MSRTQRLLNLIHLLRSRRFPVKGADLASELGISLRTLYRDIGVLQEQGACIEGEPGLGYVLRPGFMLPPLMFSDEEIEALVLGARWVADRTDKELQNGAKSALSKIAAVLPADLKERLDTTALLIAPASEIKVDHVDVSLIRQAVRSEHKLILHYRDLKEIESARTVWPFALGYFDHARILMAWCEERQDFRHFRTDRIVALEIASQRYPRRRQALLKAWRERHAIPSD